MTSTVDAPARADGATGGPTGGPAPTHVRLTRAGGRVRADLAGGLLSCRRLPDEDGTVRVALVATQALLLADDDVRIAVDVEDGLALELVEVAGTVAYDMQGGSADWRVDVRLGTGASLVWDALPFVVATGAHVRRRTSLDLADEACAVLRETFVLGRTGEAGGHLTTTTDARLAGRPLLVETLTVDPGARDDPALLGGARCLDTVTLLGARYDDEVPAGADVLQLDRPGTLVRTFGADAHAGDLACTVVRARRAATPSPGTTPGQAGPWPTPAAPPPGRAPLPAGGRRPRR
ncbi:Urease accessory protein UreH-like protein [Cellulomonas flavigena DSM 20109]|uniref:Urease accessory protein UreH-like protein n=1 Tax=Cellulomonas flavigena (strain ATCC 482 / DSM 20109 / BCRC 11376 / JCM 18109 / NBRC 3775 / NCIMB 8073 / NRS 134) TaxID=446466 RepID=D5UJ83_CELFN|nr:urease accessory protein UreD [Cellulomonas flavigena]ADG73606.1 Urease accessory protein UreH-like protein [Cellulomonas flavigena DSM 20109]